MKTPAVLHMGHSNRHISVILGRRAEIGRRPIECDERRRFNGEALLYICGFERAAFDGHGAMRRRYRKFDGWQRQESRPGSKPHSASAADVSPQKGLTSDEARRRLEKFGPNAMPDTSLHPLRMAIEKFWAPVPWMLEAAVVLELALGKYVEAAIIAVLLVFNAALGLFQESRACAVVIGLAQPAPTAAAAASELEAKGFRMLAIAAGPPTAMKLAELIALSDPPRPDSAALVTELHKLGVRTVMVTGDAPATAAIVAKAVGLDGPVCPPGPIPDAVQPEQFAVFASVLPEDKYKLVKAFQNGGHTIGMCGDGANDAPALRQAQMGIAVSTATDVAKSAAGIVLTEPGLAGIVAAVKEGRVIFQRIQTYTLNSIIKKIVTVLFLIVGLILTGHAILTLLLMVIVMITGDFLTMSLTTDNVRPSAMPNAWRIGNLTMARVLSWVSACWPSAAALWRLANLRWALGLTHCGPSPLSSWCSVAKRRSTPFVNVGTCGARAQASGSPRRR